jgi:hypothetical protein
LVYLTAVGGNFCNGSMLPAAVPLRAITVSGRRAAEDLERSRAAGFDRHLSKPTDPAVLESILREAAEEVRLKVRTNSEVKVLIGQKHWSVRSGRQLRRRETRWRAAGSERPVHKENNDELDSA